MSCPMTEAMDCLFQTAPHIILFEPTQSHSRKDLYHQMVANERHILELRQKRNPTFPKCVTKRACRWCRQFAKIADPEEHEALVLSESARSSTLAVAYNVNASTKHLEKKTRARAMIRHSFEAFRAEQEKRRGSRTSSVVRVDIHNDSPLRKQISQEIRADGTTITTTAILPSSSSSSTAITSATSVLPSASMTSAASGPAKSPSSHTISFSPLAREIDAVTDCRKSSMESSMENFSGCRQLDSQEDCRALLDKREEIDEKDNVETVRMKWWEKLCLTRRR